MVSTATRNQHTNARHPSGTDPAPTSAAEARYRDNLFRDLFGGDRPGSRLPDKTKRLIRSEILPVYAKASLEAKRHQRLYRRAGTLVYCLVPLAVAAVATAVLFPALSAAAYFLEFLLLATILLVVLWADRRRSHRGWLQARFRVERLRAAVFLAACGVAKAEPALADLKEVWAHVAQGGAFPQAHRAALEEFVLTSWIGEQIRYHDNRAKRCARASRWLERTGMAVFFAALMAAAIHAAPLFTGHSAHGTWADSGLTLAAIVLPAVGAALGGLRSHREYSRLARTSRGMTAALAKIEQRFAAADSPTELTALLRETDELIVRENQDWLQLMSEAKLEAST